MTVAEKSTELGYSLSDLWWTSKTLCDNCNVNDAWHCTIVEGMIPADANQRGSKLNTYYYSSEGDVTITENSSLEDIEIASKVWIDNQEYIENDAPVVSTPKTS
jgi:hypothetical protein